MAREPVAARSAGVEPSARVLGDESFRTLITHSGTGGCWQGEQALTAWRDDRVEDTEGWFVYLRDLSEGTFWSIGSRPIASSPDRYQVEHGSSSVTIARRDHGIDASMEVWVDGQRAAECRLLTLRNRSSRSLRIELTTYVEIVLQGARHHAAHPAFSKLFVQTEAVRDGEILLAHRRPRAPGDQHPWLAQSIRGGERAGHETDRARFLGRGRGVDVPLALTSRAPLSGTVGDVLDPIFCQRRVAELAPGETACFELMLAASSSREQVLSAVDGSPPSEPAHRDGGARQGDSTVATRTPPAATGTEPLRCFNGFGGFSSDGDEYVIRLARGEDGFVELPPRPWINVLANPSFGTIVSETGAGYTWSGNSREHRITPWSNDPVRDPHGEALYMRDEETGRFWSAFAGPAPGDGPYEMRHGFGYSRCRHQSQGLELETDVFVHATQPMKVVRLRIVNPGDRPRRVSAVSYQRLVLGELAEDAAKTVNTWALAPNQILMARQAAPERDVDRVAFSAPIVTQGRFSVRFITHRERFLGPGGTARPAALTDATAWAEEGTTGVGTEAGGADPCFVAWVSLEVGPGESRTCAFVLGEGADPIAATSSVEALLRPGALDEALESVRSRWQDLLGRVRVETPVESIDLLVNGWLAYQTLACRLWARTALYQSGGAFGFRDQLQDAAAFQAIEPWLTRDQLLLHAAHQFVEGDVLHWWHPPHGRGIRTRFADDLLWLPFVTASYVRSTGDASVLEERVPFLTSRALRPGEDEAYLAPRSTKETAELYEHCCLAIDRSLGAGAHGLPLFGGGDWNDGMNRIGREGSGESVWMACFLFSVLEDFIPLCESRGDSLRVSGYREHQRRLSEALETSGWDGDWYRRGYYDDGAPLGSRNDEECRIDALVQAWATLSGAAPRERCERAMDAVESNLVSWEDGMVRLLTPPFDRTTHDPGYIKGYVPGVRENGGQYTHAALWVVAAMARLGRRDRAARLLELLSPVTQSRSRERATVYQAEPYVVAADVSGNPQHRGRAGWTWYTGSSGWMLRIALEEVLGVRLEGGDTVVVRAAIPASWPGYSVTLRPWGRRGLWHIRVVKPSGEASEVVRIRLDGREIEPAAGVARIPVGSDDGDHRAEVELG